MRAPVIIIITIIIISLIIIMTSSLNKTKANDWISNVVYFPPT